MALGLALMMGIKLPLYFNSPDKARVIIDFWRRWHMKSSRFSRHYLYNPLSGNSRGERRGYLYLMLTMLLTRGWLNLRGMGRAAWDLPDRESRLGASQNERRQQARNTHDGRLTTFLAVVVTWRLAIDARHT